MKNIKQKRILIITTFIFFIISIITIYSSTNILSSYMKNLYIKQLLWYVLGLILILIINRINIEKIYKNIWIIYIIINLLLLLLLFIGKEINGAKCWFKIAGITIQPSEFMKTCLIILISKEISKKKEKDIIQILKIFLILIPPCILTFLEPDTGNVIIYIIITIFILFVSGLKKRWFISLGLFIILSITTIYQLYNANIIKNIVGNNMYLRINRIIDWKQNEGYQINKSITTIGSSKLLGNGIKKNPLYLPESHTDFIFSIYSSTFGYIGTIILITIIIIFDINILNIIKNTNKKKYKLYLAGFLGMILFQQFQNISMTFGLMPITGITLPFISYGGSNIIILMTNIGIIINIINQKKLYNKQKTAI